MVVTLDLGEERLLHPLNKQAFGHRLALWARANVYRENIVWSGPLVVSAKRAGNSTLVRFEHAEGLKAKQDPVIGFEYRAGDNTWKTVTAHIRDNHVVITNPPGESPRAIRYAWANNPQHNLVNAAGLPASPFLIDFTTTHPAYDSNRRRDNGRVKTKKTAPPDLVRTPLVPVDISRLSDSTNRLDIFLLMGQSNMKGRGVMPAGPLRDPLSYGPAEYRTSEEVVAIADALAAIDDNLLREAYRPDLMQEYHVYPDVWDRPDEIESNFEWICEHFHSLVDYYRNAAARGNAMLEYLG